MDESGANRGPWADVLARAHATWPADWIPDADFIQHVTGRLPPGRPPTDVLPKLSAGDLYLACACARGVGAAVEAFARTILAEVDAHVAKFNPARAFADEVRQVLSAKLLVAAPGRPAKIADYEGSAPLSAWVRVAAMRVAIDQVRARPAEVERKDDRALAALPAGGDVEVEVLRRRYGGLFEDAIKRALATLVARERTLLRLRLVEGMEVEQIATMYRVHRTTVTRWLGACRAHLLEEVRRLLAEEHGLTVTEVDSLAGLMQSQLHVSVTRLLREA